jgi:hypothetical protein
MGSLPTTAGTAALATTCLESHVLPISSLLQEIPPHINEFCKKVFDIKDKVILSTQEYEAYWPYLDNMFVLNKTNCKPTQIVQYWYCHLYPKQTHISQLQLQERKRHRNSQIGISCPYRIWSVHDGTTVTLTRLSRHQDKHMQYQILDTQMICGIRKN